MLIDFHVHMFPEALAKKTLPKLAHISGRDGQDAPYFTDGTLQGTLRRLDEWGVDRAVTDYISGMSDEYATSTFESLFVPQKWQIL